jgi:hypothetical protein
VSYTEGLPGTQDELDDWYPPAQFGQHVFCTGLLDLSRTQRDDCSGLHAAPLLDEQARGRIVEGGPGGGTEDVTRWSGIESHDEDTVPGQRRRTYGGTEELLVRWTGWIPFPDQRDMTARSASVVTYVHAHLDQAAEVAGGGGPLAMDADVADPDVRGNTTIGDHAAQQKTAEIGTGEPQLGEPLALKIAVHPAVTQEAPGIVLELGAQFRMRGHLGLQLPDELADRIDVGNERCLLDLDSEFLAVIAGHTERFLSS